MDQSSLHKQRRALANPEQPGVLRARRLGGEGRTAGGRDEAGGDERLEERLLLEVAVERVADPVGRERRPLDGDRLAVGEPDTA